MSQNKFHFFVACFTVRVALVSQATVLANFTIHINKMKTNSFEFGATVPPAEDAEYYLF